MGTLATWLSIIVAALKLLGSLAKIASDSKLENESDAAALGRILADAQKTINDANAARLDARSNASKLQHTDEFTRD
jgi:hypothetical protein